MFDNLIDVLLQFAEYFRFYTIVRHYHEGVVLRFGVYHRTIKPGLRWLWPLGVEDAILDGVVTRTSCTSNQALTTADNKMLLNRTMLRWRSRDI